MSCEDELAGLIEWQQAFAKKQADLIQWQEGVMKSIKILQSGCTATLEGCNILMKTDAQLGIRLENIEKRLKYIANKRIRRLEDAVARVLPR